VPSIARRTVPLLGLSAVTAVLAVSAALVVPVSAAGSQAAAATAPTAQVWITTPDGTQRLAPATGATFHRGGSDRLTITVDPTRRYQTMRGFGASITDSSAVVLSRLRAANRDAAMADLFSPRSGDALSVLRQPMGASDFVAGEFYTYDDVPAGKTDYAMHNFTVAHDRVRILPLLRQALALNPDLTVVATPWSPPAWMKTNGSLIGGRLIDDPAIYRAYAQYFVMFVQAYQQAGVPVHAVTLQNEPQNRHPSAYPGTDLPAWQETKLAAAVGAAFDAAGLGTTILGYDHNWSEHPGDIASTPPGEDPETDYPYRLLRSPEAQRFDGIAYHCYSGDPSDMTKLHDAFPGTEIWFTECSGSHGLSDPPAQVFSDTLKWHARNLVLGVTRNWSSTVVNWNLALDPSGGPHNGGCDSCTGVVTVGPGQTVTRNAEYYTLGHLARFVRPGAQRIASTSFGTTGWNGAMMDTAFRNPDGTIVLVAHNENDAPASFAVAQAGSSFGYTLPGGALATFVWPSSTALDDGHRLLDLHGATASASEGADAGNAIDDDAVTRWTTGAAQHPGQTLTVDLGTTRQVGRVALDTGAITEAAVNWGPGQPSGDYPRGVALSTSTDGVHWTRATTAAGSGQLTVLDFRSAATRYLRIEQTATAASWWSVADLRVYT
jgi:glucosylceramidase